VTRDVDRRTLLGAGGLLTLGAVLAACRNGEAAPATPVSSAAAGATTATATATSAAATPTASATDLLSGAGTCTLTPETIAGPTWFDAHAVRSDVRDGRPGVPLALALRVVRADGCTPVASAVVDLWQCDALGVYSGFTAADPGSGGRPGGVDEYGDAQARRTDPGTALRGTQVTGPDGVVQFATVYPGWYPTRSPHLHLKVHREGTTVLTTQVFFDDAVSDAVYAGNAPYRQRLGRDTRNDTDAFFRPAALLRTAVDGDRWLAAINLGVP
jgi:protocatechuate 3,4-dioxygenase beta subunit